MSQHFYRSRRAIKIIMIVSFALLVVAGLEASLSAHASGTTTDRQGDTLQIPNAVADATDTLQDFDAPGAGTPYIIGVQAGSGPVVASGGPINRGQLMRLASGSGVANQATIAFNRTYTGAAEKVVVDFDFRIVPGTGRADGLGFAFLNTADYGTTGVIAPVLPPYVNEEPHFVNSLGIGFDVYQSTAVYTEVSNNHISLHFNGALSREIDVPLAQVDMGNGQWLHARIIIQAGNVNVSLTPCGSASSAFAVQAVITGFTPYEGRALFGARAGGLLADHDLDNVLVQYLTAAQNPPAFTNRCYALIENNFDQVGAGAPFTVGVHASALYPATRLGGGPTGQGQFVRLAHGSTLAAGIPLTSNTWITTANQNSLAFDRGDAGAFEQIVADFDFRIIPATGRGDGFGFALLNTANYGTVGPIPPQAPLYAAEEPNFINSLGIGFDIYSNTYTTPVAYVETNDNHLSMHFNGVRLGEFDARPALDLAGGEWVHARVIMRPGGGYSDVTVILAQCGRPASTVINQFKVPGFVPYEGRVYFAARAGGVTANHDIDNVRVQFFAQAQSVLSFDTGCYVVAETAGAVTLTVARALTSTGSVMVNYATSNGAAQAGADYGATSGSLTFSPNELTKTLTIPILDDAVDEGDESFLVTLSDPTGSAHIGGPITVKVKIVDDEAARRLGSWGELIPLPVVPIHAHLLPNRKVLMWDRHDSPQGSDGEPRLWEPTTDVLGFTGAAAVMYDLFCSGHSFLPDGNLLVTGGHITNGIGVDNASIYNPILNSWTPVPPMNTGRWYPSNVTLPSGEVLVMAGTYTPGINMMSQVWEVGTNQWRDLIGAPLTTTQIVITSPKLITVFVDANYYPWLYVAPNGQVFDAGPQQRTRYLDPTGLGRWTDVATSTMIYREYGSSVMYDVGKILNMGGNLPEPDDPQQPSIIAPSASAEVIDLNAPNPAWRPVAPMSVGRRHHNATILPDGHVLVTGGSSVPGFNNSTGAVLTAELWNPASKTWTPLAAQSRYRGYHSVALLLPDGRVAVGGGGHPEPEAGAQYNFEVFSPPYLFKGPRPTIITAPLRVQYNQPFFVQTPDVSNIVSATWIRLGSVTHAFNQNQRINHLAFTKVGGGLMITTPLNANHAPPGHYMLFILNDKGVPSLAHIMQIGVQTPNSAPVARDDVFTLTTGAILSVNAPGILDNDTDANGDSLTVSMVTAPLLGTLTINPNGAFTYKPNTCFIGDDQFTYHVSDSMASSNAATVTIKVRSCTIYLPLIMR